MSKNSSAQYYQHNKERLHKKFVKDTKVSLKKKIKKSNNMIVKDTKISQKMKSKTWLSIEKKYYKLVKACYSGNYGKLIYFALGFRKFDR